MGHIAKAVENRCDVLDELEAAITLGHSVRVMIEGGTHRAGQPIDLYTADHEDFLQLKDHLPIPVSQITRVEKV